MLGIVASAGNELLKLWLAHGGSRFLASPARPEAALVTDTRPVAPVPPGVIGAATQAAARASQ